MEAVQHSANLSHVIGNPAMGADGVELVEEVDAAGSARGVENLPQLGGGLPHVLGDEPVEPNLEERKAEFPSQDGCSHCLSRAGRTGQQKLSPRRQAVLHDSPGMALLSDDPPNLIGEHIVQDHLAQPGLRIGRLQKVGQFTARAADRYRWAYAASSLGVVNHGSQLFRKLAVTESRLVGGDLHGDREESIVVAVHVRLQQRLDLLSTGHESDSGGALEESYPEHLHHLVAEVVDDLDRDAA